MATGFDKDKVVYLKGPLLVIDVTEQEPTGVYPALVVTDKWSPLFVVIYMY